MDAPTAPPLEGTLHQVPFHGADLAEAAVPQFEDLVATHGIHDVLLVKRFSTDADAITSRFARAVDAVESPEVAGLSRLAVGLLEDLPDPPRRLSRSESNLLLGHFLAGRDWEHPCLRRASGHESFSSNVRRFVTEATCQGAPIDTDDRVLAELARARDDYHDWIAAIEYRTELEPLPETVGTHPRETGTPPAAI